MQKPYAHIKNDRRRNEGKEQPHKHAGRKLFLLLQCFEEPHVSHDCFLWCETTSRPPQGPITIKHVTWLIGHALLSDSAPYHLTPCCSIRPGRTPLCIYMRVCVWCQHSRGHTLWTDADG